MQINRSASEHWYKWWVVKNTQVIYVDGTTIIAFIEHSISHHFGDSWNAINIFREGVGSNFWWYLGQHLAFAWKKWLKLKVSQRDWKGLELY